MKTSVAFRKWDLKCQKKWNQHSKVSFSCSLLMRYMGFYSLLPIHSSGKYIFRSWLNYHMWYMRNAIENFIWKQQKYSSMQQNYSNFITFLFQKSRTHTFARWKNRCWILVDVVYELSNWRRKRTQFWKLLSIVALKDVNITHVRTQYHMGPALLAVGERLT